METLLGFQTLSNAKKPFLPEFSAYTLAGKGGDYMPMKTETRQLEIAKHPPTPLFNMRLMIIYPRQRIPKIYIHS